MLKVSGTLGGFRGSMWQGTTQLPVDDGHDDAVDHPGLQARNARVLRVG